MQRESHCYLWTPRPPSACRVAQRTRTRTSKAFDPRISPGRAGSSATGVPEVARHVWRDPYVVACMQVLAAGLLKRADRLAEQDKKQEPA